MSRCHAGIASIPRSQIKIKVLWCSFEQMEQEKSGVGVMRKVEDETKPFASPLRLSELAQARQQAI